MAVISFILGGFVGLIGALLGWIVWDMSLLQAFGFYLAASLGSAALAIAANALQTLVPAPAPRSNPARG